jgi:RHS repeat-associated protein
LSWIGKENDVESSLGDFGARKYDPELGRFTSVDPLWEEMPGSSPFHYCFNNPIMMRDPFGLEPDGFKNQLTDLEWQCGGEQEEASPIKAASEYSERVKKETIRANKIAWNLQMRDRAAADKIHLTLDVAGIFDPTPCSDLTNAGLYVSEGNYLAAGISIVGVLPWIGDIFKSTRITAAMARLAERGAVKGGTVLLKPLGLGSTGRTVASNLTEQLAMKEILSNPGMGRVIRTGLNDARWSGWSKMAWNNAGVEIHYVAKYENGVLKAVDDFKFIGK